MDVPYRNFAPTLIRCRQLMYSVLRTSRSLFPLAPGPCTSWVALANHSLLCFLPYAYGIAVRRGAIPSNNDRMDPPRFEAYY